MEGSPPQACSKPTQGLDQTCLVLGSLRGAPWSLLICAGIYPCLGRSPGPRITCSAPHGHPRLSIEQGHFISALHKETSMFLVSLYVPSAAQFNRQDIASLGVPARTHPNNRGGLRRGPRTGLCAEPDAPRGDLSVFSPSPLQGPTQPP